MHRQTVPVTLRDGNAPQVELVFYIMSNAMTSAMAVWFHVEIRVSSPKQRLNPLFNIHVRISVLITRYCVMENVLRVQLCVEQAVLQTQKRIDMKFVMGFVSQNT